MTKSPLFVTALVALISVLTSLPAVAGIPFPPFSTCRISIVQNPCRPRCIANFEPDVLRLCPSSAGPVFDKAEFAMSIYDALNAPVVGATLSIYELSGTANIAVGGSTTAITDSNGKGTVTVDRGSGCGRIGVCADGVLICAIPMRSPDVANTGLPSGCVLPTSGTSFVNSNDKNNPSCGFVVHFGAVTPGVNDCWDLNCDNFVNSTDVNGGIEPPCPFGSGWLQHFGHGAPLGAKSTCP